jgi:hypothetical protein
MALEDSVFVAADRPHDLSGLTADAVDEVTMDQETPTKAERPKRTLLRPLFAARDEPPVAAESDTAGAADEADARARPLDILRMAIAHRLCVTTTYNKRRVLLAPHIVFNRHDEPFLRAVTVELDDKPPREAKLGTFKLTGLGPLALTGRAFEPFGDFHADDAEYAGMTLVTLA